MPIADLAKLAYPGDDDARHKVRATLFSLQRQNRVKRAGRGEWETVEP